MWQEEDGETAGRRDTVTRSRTTKDSVLGEPSELEVLLETVIRDDDFLHSHRDRSKVVKKKSSSHAA